MDVIESKEVRIRGAVQGVGFRPTVWRLAHANALVGEVQNDGNGVLIRISGTQANLTSFLNQLPDQAPLLASIDEMVVRDFAGQNWNYKDFRIVQSAAGGSDTEVSADAATCSQCRQEINDQRQHRFRYPFTNCTHCGPRLSIIKGIPYDRANTTMAEFPMCAHCRNEYENPADRRFHAQPIACHHCGPRLFHYRCNSDDNANAALLQQQSNQNPVEYSEQSLALVQYYLAAGKIVAIKGIGGFHLSCDASNNEAVERLRRRKHRYAKPLALMTHDPEIIKHYCLLSEAEQAQLQSPQAPIVLLQQHADKRPAPPLSEQISPNTNLLGFMLPYTPLHWLICQRFAQPLVMTSGNLSDEPQVIDNQEALNKLAHIADLIVFHNREIANRIDDSVLRFMVDKPRLLRRARGYAPRSIKLPEGFAGSPDLLAYGAELKSTFCLLKDGAAIVSQHQGDLEDPDTFDDYEKNLTLYQALFEHRPKLLVADKHPEYLSGKLAKKMQADRAHNIALIEVQHHHAHIAACLAENKVPIQTPKVLGIALDGLGFGDNNELWGGEFLLADYCEYRRVGSLMPTPMIGGFKAIHEPWRSSYAHIVQGMSWNEFAVRYGDSDLYRFFQDQPLPMLEQMLAAQVNVPLASSCGRLFDAVAATLGLCRERAQFEGEGAMALEMLVLPDRSSNTLRPAYKFDIENIKDADAVSFYRLNSKPMWFELLDDLAQGVGHDEIATRFHLGLINGIMSMVKAMASDYQFDSVALSGGCLQNKVLLAGLNQSLSQAGFTCLSQALLPANDGGISLGQAAVAAARSLRQSRIN